MSVYGVHKALVDQLYKSCDLVHGAPKDFLPLSKKLTQTNPKCAPSLTKDK